MTTNSTEANIDEMFDAIFEEESNDDIDEETIIDEMTNDVTESGILSIPIETTDDTDKESDDVSEEETIAVKNTFSNHYSMRLADAELIDGMFTLSEFGKMDIVYKQIVDPSGHLTDYFSSHCNIGGAKDKEGVNLVYETSNQLSKKYIMTSLEKLVNYIKSNIAITSDSIKYSPFVSIWSGLTNKSLQLVEDSIERDMFDIYTGMSVDKTFTCNTNEIELVISNSYDGKKAIHVGLTLSIIGVDETGAEVKMRDYFTLSHVSSKYLHKGIQVASIQDTLKDLDENFLKDIDILKNHPIETADVKALSLCLRKGRSKKFKATWEELPKHYKNLYFTLMLLSSVLNESYSASEHVNLQSAVSKLVKKAHAHKTANAIAAAASAAPVESLLS